MSKLLNISLSVKKEEGQMYSLDLDHMSHYILASQVGKEFRLRLDIGQELPLILSSMISELHLLMHIEWLTQNVPFDALCSSRYQVVFILTFIERNLSNGFGM